ncbi:MAG TPA: hypothetical protein VGG14_04990 [Candidatus Sulfotelmatobacter sp.]
MAKQNGKQAEMGEMEQTVTRAVAQALQEKLPELQAQVVQRVLETLPSQADAPAAANENVSGLVDAVSKIHAGTTQKEILRALLDAGSAHCARIALFVVKAGAATGWQARGFGDDESVKDTALDLSAGPAAHAYRNRMTTPGNVAEMSGFAEKFGGPANEQVLVLPLALKDKVAALVYADGGDSGRLNSDVLELLVMATSAWLEVVSLRKTSVPREEQDAHVDRPTPVQSVSSFPDPFASHTPKHTAVAVAVEPAPAAEVVEVASAHAASAAAPAVAADPLAGLSAEDADVHRKAQRFARLLVDEIKLYNQAKVAEGRRNKDLYDRLKEDIDKSKGTFQKRYGSTVAASGDYFQAELVRSLAEDDASVMGANFHK